MSKINILKDKISGKRVGEFSTTDSQIIILKFNLHYCPEYKKIVYDFLNKNFEIKSLNQSSDRRGRGSITRSKVPDASNVHKTSDDRDDREAST